VFEQVYIVILREIEVDKEPGVMLSWKDNDREWVPFVLTIASGKINWFDRDKKTLKKLEIAHSEIVGRFSVTQLHNKTTDCH